MPRIETEIDAQLKEHYATLKKKKRDERKELESTVFEDIDSFERMHGLPRPSKSQNRVSYREQKMVEDFERMQMGIASPKQMRPPSPTQMYDYDIKQIDWQAVSRPSSSLIPKRTVNSRPSTAGTYRPPSSYSFTSSSRPYSRPGSSVSHQPSKSSVAIADSLVGVYDDDGSDEGSPEPPVVEDTFDRTMTAYDVPVQSRHKHGKYSPKPRSSSSSSSTRSSRPASASSIISSSTILEPIFLRAQQRPISRASHSSLFTPYVAIDRTYELDSLTERRLNRKIEAEMSKQEEKLQRQAAEDREREKREKEQFRLNELHKFHALKARNTEQARHLQHPHAVVVRPEPPPPPRPKCVVKEERERKRQEDDDITLQMQELISFEGRLQNSKDSIRNGSAVVPDERWKLGEFDPGVDFTRNNPR